MIVITVQQAAKRRGITKAYQLQTELSLSPSVAADLWRMNGHEDATLPSLRTLNTLCEAWKCPLTELVKWVPDKRLNGKKPSRKAL